MQANADGVSKKRREVRAVCLVLKLSDDMCRVEGGVMRWTGVGEPRGDFPKGSGKKPA